jgi:hypothetical protein
MKRILTVLCFAAGVIVMGIALLHILIGPSVIPGGVPVNATMDSEDRFYAALFLGFGAVMIWCARDLPAREGVARVLWLVLFLGGVSRLVSIAEAGPPGRFFLAMLALELVLPPLLWFPLAALGRAEAATLSQGPASFDRRRNRPAGLHAESRGRAGRTPGP